MNTEWIVAKVLLITLMSTAVVGVMQPAIDFFNAFGEYAAFVYIVVFVAFLVFISERIATDLFTGVSELHQQSTEKAAGQTERKEEASETRPHTVRS